MREPLLIALIISNFCFGQNLIDKKGLRQGKWIKFYKNSKAIQFQGEFVDDEPVGIFTYFKKDGTISAKMQHLGNHYARIQYYHANGNVMTDGYYLNEKKDSTWYNYTYNGMLSSIEAYDNDRLHGTSITFYIGDFNVDNPKIFRKVEYDLGKINGVFKEYFPSGNIKVEGYYNQGLASNQWKEFRNDQSITKIYKFKNGNLHGWVYLFDKDGSLINRSFYKEGEYLEGNKLDAYFRFCEDNNLNPEN